MIEFYKYQGAGNDFVIIDNRSNSLNDSKEKMALEYCKRNFGVGSDGIIFIENSLIADFKMDFLNPDGSRSFCGNGSRCAVRFVSDQKIVLNDELSFEAVDGVHKAIVKTDTIKIKMNDVSNIEKIEDDYLINTGSPHFVSFKNNLSDLDIISVGKSIRYSDRFRNEGVIYNAVDAFSLNHLAVITYERGVENETLACGTGVTACVLGYAIKNDLSNREVVVKALGGELSVSYEVQSNHSFFNIWLSGPAKIVFKGEVYV